MSKYHLLFFLLFNIQVEAHAERCFNLSVAQEKFLSLSEFKILHAKYEKDPDSLNSGFEYSENNTEWRLVYNCLGSDYWYEHVCYEDEYELEAILNKSSCRMKIKYSPR